MKNCRVSIERNNIMIDENCFLAGDIFLPQTNVALPTIVLRTPYGRNNIRALFDPLEIVRNGFALLVQDVRGRGESSGIFDPFVNEVDDGNKTIEWIRQQKWSNNQVYALGVSYEGYTAMMCNINAKIDGFASIVSTKRIRERWFFEGGKVKQAFVQAWAHSFAFTDKNRLSDKEKENVRKLADNLPYLYQLPLKEFPTAKYLPYYNSWINKDDLLYWDEIEKSSDVDLGKSSGYYVSGWYDIFCEGTIEDFIEAASSSKQPQKLVIGPWNHNDLYSSLVGAVDFGISTLMEIDAMDIIRWFKKLSCSKNKVESEVVIYIMGMNQWKYFKKWPVDCNYLTLYLYSKQSALSVNGDGYLSRENTLYEGCDNFCQKVNDFVPSVGGRCLYASTEQRKGGAYDQRDIEKRSDVLIYTSDILGKSITILGLVKSQIIVMADMEQATIHMKVTDVGAQHSINVIDSCMTVNKECYNQCVMMELGNIAYQFKRGHKIRIIISATAFPRISVDEFLYSSCCNVKIFWGKNTPSCIYLPQVNI